MLSYVVHQIGKLAYPLFERFSVTAWNNAPRPESARAVTRGVGHDPDRVLLTGGSSAVAWGVVSHDLGLAGYLARATAAITRRGVDIEVYSYPRLDTPGVQANLTPTTISRYDAIVLTLGGRESFELLPTSTWREQVTELLDHIAASRESPPQVIIVGAEEISPVPLGPVVNAVAMGRAKAFNAITREIIATRPGVTFVTSGFTPPHAGARGVLDADQSTVYDAAAKAIAPTLARVLDSAPDRVKRHIDEDARDRAVRDLQARFDPSDPRVPQLLKAITEVLDMAGAALYVVDHAVVRLLVSTLDVSIEVPREESVCANAIEHPGGFVVGDLTQDARFRGIPDVVGKNHLRFYAGYPVESPDGHPVAVLAVVDTTPREFAPADLALLRDYAHRVGSLLFER